MSKLWSNRDEVICSQPVWGDDVSPAPHSKIFLPPEEEGNVPLCRAAACKDTQMDINHIGYKDIKHLDCGHVGPRTPVCLEKLA